MSLRRVTGEMQRQVTPLLLEHGFVQDRPRVWHKPIGRLAVVVDCRSVPVKRGRSSAPTGGSFVAKIGIDFFGTGASFLPDVDRGTFDHATFDGMTFRIHLRRTGAYPPVDLQPDIWPIFGIDDIEPAVADLAAAIRDQGLPLVERWSDPAWAYEQLGEIADRAVYVDETRRDIAVLLPGTLGSMYRLQVLAVLADLNGEPELEARHLRDYIELADDPRMTRRLEDLDPYVERGTGREPGAADA